MVAHEELQVPAAARVLRLVGRAGRGAAGGNTGGRHSRGRGDGEEYDASPFSGIRYKSFAELVQLAEQYGSSMYQGDLVAMFSRLKVVPGASKQQKLSLLQQLLQLLQPQLQQVSPRGLSEVLLACSKLGCSRATLYESAIQVCCSKVEEADARTLSNAIYAVATAADSTTQQHCWPFIEQHLLPAFLHLLDKANVYDICNTVWSLGAMGQQLPTASIQLLVGELLVKLDGATARSVANTIHGVAKLGQCIPPEQLEPLLLCVVQRLDTASTQNIGNLLWGVAKMSGQVPPAVFGQIVDALIADLSAAIPQAITNTLWAAATMGQPLHPQQLQQLLLAFVDKLPEAAPQSIGNTFWAVARYRPAPFFPSPLLTPRAVQGIIEKVPNMTAQELSNVAWACGAFGHRNDKLLLALYSRAIKLLVESKNQSAVFTPQNIANVCWAGAVLNLKHLAHQLQQLAAAGSSRWKEFPMLNKLQLYQLHMWLSEQQCIPLAAGLLSPGFMTAGQIQECRVAWQQNVAGVVGRASTLERSVFAAIQQLPELGATAVLKAPTPDGLSLCDISATTITGVQIAVQVCGPFDLRLPDMRPVGSAMYRDRALVARGYVLVIVPYWEWSKVGEGKPLEQQVAYLSHKLRQALQAAGQK